MFKKILKNQLIILTLLLLTCICQKLIKMPGLENNISAYLIILYLILHIPELGKLIIPFSLFLGIIITYYQLHTHNEILAMYSCGTSKNTLIHSVLLCSITTSCISVINLFWLYPYCEQYQNNILYDYKTDIHFNKCSEKKFQPFLNKNSILFIDYINKKKLENIFIIHNKYHTNEDIIGIVTAKHGTIHDHPTTNNYSQSILLKIGSYYELHNNQNICTNIYITNFYKNHISIENNFVTPPKNNNIVNNMCINQLWNSPLLEAHVELHWRLTLLISVFIMPIIALLLNIKISHQHLPNFIIAMTLYIMFFILHILLKSYGTFYPEYSTIWVWLIHFIYFIIIFLINFKEKSYLKTCYKRYF